MTTVTAYCRTCTWRWKPKRSEGIAADTARAIANANAHGAEHPDHVVVSYTSEQTMTPKGSKIRFLNLEITRG